MSTGRKTTRFVGQQDMASANGNLDFLKLLQQQKPSDFSDMLMQKNEDEYIPLHWAVLNQQEETARFLLETNPEQVNVKNIEDQTPLDLALENMDEKMVEILAEKMQIDERELSEMEESIRKYQEETQEEPDFQEEEGEVEDQQSL